MNASKSSHYQEIIQVTDVAIITQGSIAITLQLLPPEVFAITITLQLHQKCVIITNHYNYRLQQPCWVLPYFLEN